ncbi:MAG: alpha/beta hydrolase [Ramlibacter sp.]|nr:alpha/beta hydrolase [Ramlibacter sp.]
MEPLRPEQAARLFLRPARKADAPSGPPFPDAQRTDLDFEGAKVALWQAGAGPTVLVLHGWEGTAADMRPFILGLLESRFRVLALEFPGHGASEGKSTSLFQCTRAVNQAIAHFGPVHAILAHSVGCAVAVEAMKAGARPKAAVLISTPARYKDYVMQFGSLAGLDGEGIKQMIEELRKLDVDVSAINTPEAVKTLDVPALLIHSDDDRIIPQALGREVANAWPGAKFMSVSGLGHRKILSAPSVVDASVSFLQGQLAP